jgi:hypothetical protein
VYQLSPGPTKQIQKYWFSESKETKKNGNEDDIHPRFYFDHSLEAKLLSFVKPRVPIVT